MWANLVNAYQRDLADFVNTVTTDTTRALTAITTGLPTSDDESDDGLPPDEVENDQESPVHGAPVTRPRPSASAKQEAQMMALEALEARADTYMKDPSEPGAAFEAWCHEFKVQDSVEHVEQILGTCPLVRRQYDRLVPEQVSFEMFWKRYIWHAQRALEVDTVDELVARIAAQPGSVPGSRTPVATSSRRDILDDLDDPEDLDLTWDLEADDDATRGGSAGAGGGSGAGADSGAHALPSPSGDAGDKAVAAAEALLREQGSTDEMDGDGELRALQAQLAASTAENQALRSELAAVQHEAQELRAAVTAGIPGHAAERSLPALPAVPSPATPDTSTPLALWWQARAEALRRTCTELYSACLARDRRCQALQRKASQAVPPRPPALAGSSQVHAPRSETGGDSSDWEGGSWDMVAGGQSAVSPPAPPDNTKGNDNVSAKGSANAAAGGDSAPADVVPAATATDTGREEKAGSTQQAGTAGPGGDDEPVPPPETTKPATDHDDDDDDDSLWGGSDLGNDWDE